MRERKVIDSVEGFSLKINQMRQGDDGLVKATMLSPKE